MKHYQNILVAVDLTEDSADLVSRAQDIQELSQAKLNLVHVIDYTPMVYAGGEFAVPVDPESVDHSAKTNEAQEKLLELAETFNIDEERCRLLCGDKEDELVQLVEELDVDLMVVGAHDKHGFNRLLSSTADNLLHALPCDILMVKH